jgi:hypothetical protein
MAGTTVTVKRQWSQTDNDAFKAMYEAINAIIDNLDAIAAKLDADAGVTDVDYNVEVTASKLSTFESGD